MRLAFLAGFGCGVLALLFWIARSIGTAETPKLASPMTPEDEAKWIAAWKRWQAPKRPDGRYWEYPTTNNTQWQPDPYTSDLADILRREAW
jgi:hypothetical protein